jgi:hypothetical protein
VQPLAILFGAGFTLAVATALGARLLGDACRDYPVRFVAGSAVLSLLVFLLCALRVAYPLVFLAVGVVLWSGLGRPPAAGSWKIHRTIKLVFCLIFAAYFLIYLANAMAPEVSPDGSSYHLSLVGRYLRHHGFERITWNLYASLSQGVEMLFLFAFAFGKHSAAALVHFAFLLALVWQMYRYGKRAGFPLAGACAAALVFASPVVGIDGISAYNDVALAAVAFTLFFLLQVWAEERNPRLLAAIGLVAGFGYAVKYTAWVGILYAVVLVAWRSRRVSDVAVVAGCAAAMVLPWAAKNWIWVGNPVAPFFNQYFRNPYVTLEFETDYKKYFALYDLSSRWQIPRQATVAGSIGGVLGPVFLLAPLALLSLRRREGRHLLAAALVFGANYFVNIGTRFLIPVLPFVALGMMLLLASVPMLGLALVVVHAVLSWPSVVPRYCAPGAWRLSKIPWREGLRIRDTDFYMRTHLPEYPAVRLIEESTPPGATVFTYRGIPEAYTSRRVLVEFQAAENQAVGRILRTAFLPDFRPTWRLRWTFARQTLAGIRLVQTNTGEDVWTVHELRVFDGTRELAREPRRRLRAWPFPWDVQVAFDNSPLTFWRSNESIHPGMFLEVNFGALEQADSVLMESAPNQSGIRVKLEGRNVEGGWKLLAAMPTSSDAPAPLGLRRAAAAELKRRGIDYILMFDGELGADDFEKNADLWGIRPAGERGGARLYQLP